MGHFTFYQRGSSARDLGMSSSVDEKVHRSLMKLVQSNFQIINANMHEISCRNRNLNFCKSLRLYAGQSFEQIDCSQVFVKWTAKDYGLGECSQNLIAPAVETEQ